MKKISLMLMAFLSIGLYGLAGEQPAYFRNIRGQDRMLRITAHDTLATVEDRIRESGLLGEGNENREFRIIQSVVGHASPLSVENFNEWRQNIARHPLAGFVVLVPLAQAAQPAQEHQHAQGHHPQQENPQQQAQEFAPA